MSDKGLPSWLLPGPKKYLFINQYNLEAGLIRGFLGISMDFSNSKNHTLSVNTVNHMETPVSPRKGMDNGYPRSVFPAKRWTSRSNAHVFLLRDISPRDVQRRLRRQRYQARQRTLPLLIVSDGIAIIRVGLLT